MALVPEAGGRKQMGILHVDVDDNDDDRGTGRILSISSRQITA